MCATNFVIRMAMRDKISGSWRFLLYWLHSHLVEGNCVLSYNYENNKIFSVIGLYYLYVDCGKDRTSKDL